MYTFVAIKYCYIFIKCMVDIRLYRKGKSEKNANASNFRNDMGMCAAY